MEKTKCLVCGASSTEPHYGADVCRACAAFFRRRVLSKFSVYCGRPVQCEISKNRNVRSCKACRMQKCLQIGMQIFNVQCKRDKHDNPEEFVSLYLKSPMVELQVSSSVEYESMHLKLLHQNFSKMIQKRKSELPRRNCRIHQGEAVKIFKKDVRMTAEWIDATFPQLADNLDTLQRKLLFRNFYLKWTIFEPAYLAILLGKSETYHLPTGDIVDEVSRYYTRHITTPHSFNLDELARIFTPYWTDFQNTLVDKVIEANLSVHEFLLIAAIFLFDIGIEGQSDESINLCEKIRKQIYRELYFVSQYVSRTSRTEDSCFRLSQNMLLLPSIQRNTDVFEEELQLGGLYKVLVTDTDDWYTMVDGPSFE